MAVAAVAACTSRPARLTAVGPRLVSDQTGYALAVYGAGLAPGMRLRAPAPVGRDLPLEVVDAGHAYTRIPKELRWSGEQDEATVSVRLVDAGGRVLPGEAPLTIVSDSAFHDPIAMALSRDGRRLFVISSTTDSLFAVDTLSRKVRELRAGDGPRAVAPAEVAGREWIAVAHEFQAELLLFAADDPDTTRRLPAPSFASGLAVAGGVAYLAERALDTVAAIDLATGRQLWRAPVAPHPRALAMTAAGIAVGSLQTGEVEVLDPSSGARRAGIVPGPGVPIIGGGTAGYREYVMGGSAPRGLAFSPRLGRLFLSSIGPNIGPNPQRMEVSMNGGVAVLDPAGAYLRHLGFGAGVPEGLALDEARGLLYVADVALGLVRIVDAAKLAENDTSATAAVLGQVALPPPAAWPMARPAGDYGVRGRAGPELHSGPWALALAPDGNTLYVLCRFTGTVARLDVGEAARGGARLIDQIPLAPMLAHRQRRVGQALYYADLGRTGITCDACHIEGHTGGILFTKTRPMRIYRSTSILGSRDTPPYFTPASQQSLEETASFVGGRNRGHNPDLVDNEVRALAHYTGLLAVPPSPFVDEAGAPRSRLELPDGQTGDARRGLALFGQHCARCHPSPLFTTDQDPRTRGVYDDVGTPLFFPLRERMQDLGAGVYAPPSLLGVWDVFPLLNTGTAGIHALPDGRVATKTRFPLREIVEKPHGRTIPLDREDHNDLLTFLLSL